jgi:Sigma-70, region 4
VAFLLREVFETPYTDLAQTLETSEDNCRQMVARARKHIRNGQPRFNVNRDQHNQVLQEFVVACASRNATQLLNLPREDAVMFSDGGGKVRTALNPIVGADRIIRFFIGLGNKGELRDLRAEFAAVNYEPGVLVFAGDTLESVINLELDESGRIARILLVANPEKLPRILPSSIPLSTDGKKGWIAAHKDGFSGDIATTTYRVHATLVAFAHDLQPAHARLGGRSEIINTTFGNMEYAILGDGEPVLVIHSAGGEFDQGLDMAGGGQEAGFASSLHPVSSTFVARFDVVFALRSGDLCRAWAVVIALPRA